MTDAGADSGQRVTDVIADNVIQIKTVSGDVTVLVNRPLYRLERSAGEPTGLSMEEARAQPSRMLLARHEVVPFSPRRNKFPEMAVELAARADPGISAARHGPGGRARRV